MPTTRPIAWNHSPAEVRADGAVHALGVVASLAGAAVLLASVSGDLPTGRIAAVAVYLSTLVISIAVSAAYNLWPVSPAKWHLRRLDHAAIYLLIAGTYTPFMVELGLGWMLAGVWTTALLGAAVKLGWPGRFDRLAILLYLALGWSGLTAARTLLSDLSPEVFWLIVAGGLVYSLGVIFHVSERLPFQNAIWHGFVLAAASIHFLAVWFSVSA